MADRDQKVMAMVERRVKKNPDVSNQELYGKATEINSDIGKLTLRQFHARYPLQVKRKIAMGGETKLKKKQAARGKKEAKAQPDREAVRKVLLALVKDVAGANKGEIVDVVAGIDEYVDKVLKKAK